MRYHLVPPEDFTQEQENFLESIKNSFRTGFYPPRFVSGIKDINSRHIISTDHLATIVGLSCGEDVANRLDCDMPCKAAELAQDFVDEDRELLGHRDSNRKSSLLNINQYSAGIQALLTEKYPITHQPSQSILGIIFLSTQIDLSNFFTLMPNYILEFGINANIQNTGGMLTIGDVYLTEYEHEVCFLMAMNWSFKQIAHFMNKYRPVATQRTADTMYKCRDRICYKFNCDSSQIRDKLIESGLHRKMPRAFFKRLIGNRTMQ